MEKEAVQEEILDEEIEHDQYLVFSVKSQEFGIQAARVQEITSVADVAEVPNAPPHIEGIMNLRGLLVSVINFRKRFGFEPKGHDEDTRIIVVQQEGFPFGIIADSVEEVIKVPDEKVHGLPKSAGPSVSEEGIKNVGMLDDRLIILLDIDKVLEGTGPLEAEALMQAVEDAKEKASPEESGQTKEG